MRTQQDRENAVSVGPLARVEDRLPRTEWPPPTSSEAASSTRPFGLRMGRRVGDVLPTARHRTEDHQTPHPEKTNRDNKEDDDTWYTKDD